MSRRGKIGAHNIKINIKRFIFTARCVRVLKEKENLSEIHGPTKPISNQKENLSEIDESTKSISNQKENLSEIHGPTKSISNFFGDCQVEISEKNPTENSTIFTKN